MELLPTFLKKLGIAIAIALGVGLLFSVLMIMHLNGNFAYWRSLGRPPEKITRIVGTTLDSVTVETTSKTLYALDTSTRNNQWQKVFTIQVDESSNDPSCGTHSDLLTKNVVNIKVSCSLSPGGAYFSIYALRKNGNIYLWHQYQGPGEFYWTTLFLFIIFFPMGFAVGFMGTWIYFAFTWVRKLS
jgi:hypothetical protein